MKIQSLVKLDLLAVNQERKLLEKLNNHDKVLQRYIEQKKILTTYKMRLSESWRNGETVYAGDARRASKFVVQANSAYQNLIETIKIEEENKSKCELSLATMRTRRKTLLKRINVLRQIEENQILKKTEQSISSCYSVSSSKDSLFFSS